MAYSDSTCFVNCRLRIFLSKYLGLFRSSYHFSQAGAILLSNLVVCSIGNAQGPVHQATKGFQITQTQKDTTIVTVLSVEGVASKQYGADGKAIRGVIMRYRDAMAFGLDYNDRTAHSVTFKVAVANKLAENARISRIRAIPGMTSTIPNGLSAPPLLSGTTLSADIAGFHANAITAEAGGLSLRIWYSSELPQLPTALSDQLARLVVDCGPKATEDEDETHRGDEKEKDDRDRSVCSSENKSLARTLARTFALRTEVQLDGVWLTALETTDVRRVSIATGTFDPPNDLRLLPTTLSSPAGGHRAGAGFARSAAAQPQTPVSATVRMGPGPLLAHLDVYHFYWGRVFSQPGSAGAAQALTDAYHDFFHGNPAYTHALGQYGIGAGGGLQGVYFINDNPERAVGGGASFIVTAAHVIQWGFQTSAPLFWWVYGGHDPLYMIYVPTELVDASDWQGFHLATPAVANLLLPFFLWPFVHDFMPYGLAKISQNAMSLPGEGTLFRDQCRRSPTLFSCPQILSALPSFDAGTQTLSHELVEAVTDPYPFFGWSDAGKQPAASKSEIADICENNPFPFGSHTIKGSHSVATYWSNNDHACVPESRPNITLNRPTPREAFTWAGPNGPKVYMWATATDPVDGNLDTMSWTIDGTPLSQTAPSIQSSALALGPHAVTVSATDSQGLTASTAASFTVVATPPTGYIIAPTIGASVPGSSFVLRGDGTDPQDSPLLDSAFTWRINGNPSGLAAGRIAVASGVSLGPATIELTVTDSAGLQWKGTRNIVVVASTGVPSVTITSPANGSGFRVPLDNIPPSIHFSAVATDADGSLITDPLRIVWTDSIFGGASAALGTGGSLDRALSGNFGSVTVHKVVCTVTGASGKTASDSVTVYIGQII